MKIASCLELVKREEGCRLKPYRCTAGRLTIGYGRNLDDKGISSDEAAFLLTNDLSECERDCASIFGCQKWLALNEVRRAVLISMRFQLGASGFRQFTGTIGAVKGQRFSEAADHMMESLWSEQTPARALRAAEMMRTGEWCEEW